MQIITSSTYQHVESSKSMPEDKPLLVMIHAPLFMSCSILQRSLHCPRPNISDTDARSVDAGICIYDMITFRWECVDSWLSSSVL